MHCIVYHVNVIEEASIFIDISMNSYKQYTKNNLRTFILLFDVSWFWNLSIWTTLEREIHREFKRMTMFTVKNKN